MSEEPNDVNDFVVFSENAEKPSTNVSPPRDVSKEKKPSDVKNSPENTDSKAKSPKDPLNEPKSKSKKVEKTPEEGNKSPEDAKESIEVQHVDAEAKALVEDDVKLTEVENPAEKEMANINETVESLEEAKKKAEDDFTAAAEHILSSPSDLSQVVSSFENAQPIYGSEALNFRNDEENPPSPKEEKTNEDQEKAQKSGDKKIKASPENNKSKTNESEKKDADWEMKRDRKKSSVLTDADLTRKSSEDPYHIEIPLKKKISKNTRKKLWRELQKRKPFISASVYAHIQHFAKPPFQTWGCHNCGYRKTIRSYSNEYLNP